MSPSLTIPQQKQQKKPKPSNNAFNGLPNFAFTPLNLSLHFSLSNPHLCWFSPFLSSIPITRAPHLQRSLLCCLHNSHDIKKFQTLEFSNKKNSFNSSMEAGHAKEGDTSSPPRQRFYIELKPGETTIVSWKKLLKDAAANKANPSHSNNQTTAAAASTSAFVMEPASGETAQQEALFALGQLTKPIPKNAPSSSRLGSVIEKTEQLYVGNQSSDEEELDGAPDEDQYDTKDSFIDDTELDECFEVDESTTKHNGFFVNKGKLEHMNRPISSSHFQPKKSKNNMQKAREEKDGDHVRDKHAKLGQGRMNVATGNIPMNEPFPTNTQNLAVNGITNRDDSISNTGQNDTEKQMNGVLQPGNLGRIVKDTSELSRVAYQKYQENNAPGQSAPQSKRLASETSNASSPKVSHRNKKGRHELPDLNLPHYPVQAEKKTATMHPKDVSSLQPKGSMVERAIRDLEKVVAESRPWNTDDQDADTSSMSIKRRLPFEVKQKLAKVARLAQSSQGKISEELISHLMTILGHLIQLRTLKKNLREMVEMGLTAKQEKADRFQKIKKEVMEMIELQKAIIHGEKGAINRKYVMDDKMEDKICDLYDLFVQGMDEDKGPQIRKLYAEVAELWPNGAMDNHGIKIAICREKERRRIFYNNEKAQEKARTEKLSRQWKGNNVGGKATSNARAKCDQGGVSASAAIAQYLSGPARPIPSFLKSRSDDPPKQEKLEKMTFPMLKEQMKQQKREFDRGLKKSSPKVDRKSHMSHMQDVGLQDGL